MLFITGLICLFISCVFMCAVLFGAIGFLFISYKCCIFELLVGFVSGRDFRVPMHVM
jgi:hypothetical protein